MLENCTQGLRYCALDLFLLKRYLNSNQCQITRNKNKGKGNDLFPAVPGGAGTMTNIAVFFHLDHIFCTNNHCGHVPEKPLPWQTFLFLDLWLRLLYVPWSITERVERSSFPDRAASLFSPMPPDGAECTQPSSQSEFSLS